jgi:hypothetical protein
LAAFGSNPPKEAANQVLQGFKSEYTTLTQEEEKSALLLCAGRLTLSGVLGWFSVQQNPGNEYLKKHSLPAWRALRDVVAQIKREEWV